LEHRKEYEMKIDPKGRASVPKSVRESLSEEFGSSELIVVRMTTNNYSGLWVFPPETHEKFQEKLALTSASSKAALKRIYEYHEKINFDSLGRLSLPRRFRSWASLDGDGPSGKDIVVIHKKDRLEIWDLETYDKVLAADSAALSVDQSFVDSLDEL
jgi:MraZ protein